jgi:nucleoside-diphosphate-sugar epimerase
LAKPTVFITGVAGNLGLRLLAQLETFSVVGFDLFPPRSSFPLNFVAIDFGEEKSCREFYHLLREHRPIAVVHLAFAQAHKRDVHLDVDRMWRTNVAGTARVLEAISEANRPPGPIVSQFILTGSIAAYGFHPPHRVTEDHPLRAHSLPFAVHKMEADLVAQKWSAALRGATSYILRAHFPAGANVDNCVIAALRCIPDGTSKRAERMRRDGTRFPFQLPFGKKFLEHEMQFLHPDDLARTIAHLLHRGPAQESLMIMNVAGSGDALTMAQCIQIAGARLTRLPLEGMIRKTLERRWKRGLSSVPPEALSYLTGHHTMSTEKLQRFLGSEYAQVIRHSSEAALRECFAQRPAEGGEPEVPVVRSSA